MLVCSTVLRVFLGRQGGRGGWVGGGNEWGCTVHSTVRVFSAVSRHGISRCMSKRTHKLLASSRRVEVESWASAFEAVHLIAGVVNTPCVQPHGCFVVSYHSDD